MIRLLTKIRCRLGRHKHLQVIQSFGSAQRIGCPDCGGQFAIHHMERVCVPWDRDFDEIYRSSGYELEEPLKRWHRRRASA